MSNRRKAGAKNRTVAYVAAGIVHLVIIGAMVINFTTKRETVDAFDAEKIDTVKASLIDESKIKDQEKKLKEIDRKKAQDKKREQEELAKIKREKDREKKKIEDLKVKQLEEQQKADDLKRQREAIALEKKKADEKLKKDKAKREKEAAELKKKQRAEQKRLAELKERQKALAAELEKEEARQQQDALQRQLQLEEQREAADRRAKERTTTMVSGALARIAKKIAAVRTVDPGFETWRKSVVEIKVSPSGGVLTVRTVESSGDAQYDASVEAAVFKASPLPIPTEQEDPAARQKFLRPFEYIVRHPNAKR